MGIEYYIDEFFIHPAFQGKGFGKKFMTEIEKYCLNDGLNAIILNTQKGYKSETFYKNNGFSEQNGLIILSKDL
jgi:GNAT superfamily N-acetyltransferase